MDTQTPDSAISPDSEAQEYAIWIERERRIRCKILQTSLAARERGLYRICDDCAEVCLCHEERCPNCNSPKILQTRILDAETDLGHRIRCMFRFKSLRRI